MQNALNKLFSALGKVFSVPTASALCQARQKLKPEVFQYLNEIVCQDFYSLYKEEVRSWRGHRLLSCDGTYLNLPDTPETREEFFLQTNQFKGGSAVQSLACVLYDLLNGLALSATLGARKGGEKLPLIEQMWEKTEVGDLLVLDRHYASFGLLAWARSSGREVVVRLPRCGFREARPLFKKGSHVGEKLVEIRCPVTSLRFVRENQLAESLRLRLIRVPLEGGEVEVLATTLLDGEKYPAHEFKWLYGKRWCEETFFNRVKNIFDAERFSGESPLTIRQDFYGVLFLATLESVFVGPDQQALNQQAEEREQKRRGRRPAGEDSEEAAMQPQVNRAESYVALLDRLVQLLLSKRSPEKILDEMHHLFRMNPGRARPGRRYDRPQEKNRRAQRLRYHKYGKKLIA